MSLTVECETLMEVAKPVVEVNLREEVNLRVEVERTI